MGEIKNIIIREIKLTKKSKLIISRTEFKGQQRCDIRLNVATEKDNGDLVFFPTKKGINFPLDKLNELIGSLKEVKKI